MGIDHLALFVAAGIVLNLTPGPDVLYIVTNAMRSGARCQRRDPCRHLVGRGFERGGGFAELVVAGVEPVPRAFAGQGFDAADAR